jgi:hypothetical protein
MRQVLVRFWVEAVLSGACLVLTVVTLISREWLELVFGVDPDHGSGALEWGLVVVLGVGAVVAGLLARADWRRVRTA